MEPLEISHRFEPGYGWFASSPDAMRRFNSGLAASGDTFEQTKAEVESLLRWAYEDDSLQFTHCVEEDSIAQYVSEHDAAAAEQPTAA